MSELLKKDNLLNGLKETGMLVSIRPAVQPLAHDIQSIGSSGHKS